MKKLILLCVILFSSFLTGLGQKKIELSLKSGIPVVQNISWESFSFSVEASVSKEVFKKTFFGVGIGYLINDNKFNGFQLNYDINYIDLFFDCNYYLKIKKLFMSPEIQVGYMIYHTELNDFLNSQKQNNGFYIGGGLSLLVEIAKNVYVNPGFSFAKVISDTKLLEGLDILPATYSDVSDKIIIYKATVGISVFL